MRGLDSSAGARRPRAWTRVAVSGDKTSFWSRTRGGEGPTWNVCKFFSPLGFCHVSLEARTTRVGTSLLSALLTYMRRSGVAT